MPRRSQEEKPSSAASLDRNVKLLYDTAWREQTRRSYQARSRLRALEHRIDGKCITHQAEGLKCGAIPVDFHYRKKKRKHGGNEDQEGRGVSGIGILRSIKRAQSAQSRQHLQKWPGSPLHAVILDVAARD
ncbi:hypothetical protein IVA87_10745 [Bradyrhizobium sp. 147]|uniref:hypothetical protein n=1 Tax=unclassified Bradyrhizobium TaxID=2631580 RepID=UPI001FFA0923|nr:MULTISPECIES: hypothetical protein [unclassified Bradyrhizobium]MCK1546548.1 hypothetical protein [Bradyrhizobium sp. 179]MCK1624279.1 hypothetical protein [Bradyrhizobium sp. 160]MCK1679917.1 hypothetical protein [Bradyrhizobium sp. 147]